MSQITFYTNPMSRGQIVRWALHEVGAEYDEILLEYGMSMKSDEYLAINPMGKVPAIVHDTAVVTECAAICLYLANTYTGAGLSPETRDENADILRWMFFGAGPLEHAIINHSMGWGEGLGSEVEGRLGYGSYERTMQTLSALFETRDYIAGQRFTIADVYVGAQVDWGLQFNTITETSALVAYAERLRQREPYLAAKAIDGAHIAKMRNSND